MRTAEEYRELAEREEGIAADYLKWRQTHSHKRHSNLAAALREAAEMVRDHEAMEKLRNTPKATFRRSTYGNAWIYFDANEGGDRMESDPADAILGGDRHE